MTTLTIILAQMGPGSGRHMDGWDDGPSWWMVIPMVIVGLAVIAVVVWAIIAITRANRTPPAAPPTGPSPLEVLNLRYARGEIDTADFEERKRQLS